MPKLTKILLYFKYWSEANVFLLIKQGKSRFINFMSLLSFTPSKNVYITLPIKEKKSFLNEDFQSAIT